MNDHSIAFVTCVNDEELYEECIKYIDKLNIPNGYEIEKIAIMEAKSMTSAYNQAIAKSESKYKVYLHQDTFIINKNFILDSLSVFEENERIGMLGVIGTEIIPTNAIWWEAQHRKGKTYESSTGKMALLDFDNNKNEEKYTEVQAIDGFIMITQYDVKWREDIFDGWHFYDISQCIEFKNSGYKVVIPNQENPWSVHDCGMVNVKNGYEEYRKAFLENYSKDIFPLVSILIPTYNRPHFLKQSLESAIKQTYTNIEVIICDDSTNEDTNLMMQNFIKVDKRIKYIKNKQRLGKSTGLENAQKCFSLSSGEFINFLMDDDLFSLDKIEKMMNYYIQSDNISLVTSYRQLINEKGEYLQPFEATKRLFDNNTIIEGDVLAKYTISNLINVIGEPTTVLFRKECFLKNFGEYLGRQYDVLSDVSSWLRLLERGNAVYISEPLSYFRIHEKQNANDIINIMKGAIEWFYLIEGFYNNLNDTEDSKNFSENLNIWLKNHIFTINMVREEISNSDFLEINKELIDELYNCYSNVIKIIFNK